jgi:hypothetical protein
MIDPTTATPLAPFLANGEGHRRAKNRNKGRCGAVKYYLVGGPPKAGAAAIIHPGADADRAERNDDYDGRSDATDPGRNCV